MRVIMSFLELVGHDVELRICFQRHCIKKDRLGIQLDTKHDRYENTLRRLDYVERQA